jgi:hypothetical protein
MINHVSLLLSSLLLWICVLHNTNQNSIFYLFSDSSFHAVIKATSTWRKMKLLALCPNSLNKCQDVSSLSYIICDPDNIYYISLVAILHFLVLLYSSDRQIKREKWDLFICGLFDLFVHRSIWMCMIVFYLLKIFLL